MRSPLLVGVAASAGTFVAMGAATFLVSGAVLTVTKRVIRQRKVGKGGAAACMVAKLCSMRAAAGQAPAPRR